MFWIVFLAGAVVTKTSKNYGTYTVNNVTSGQSSVETIGVVAFTGTSLSDYDANAVKKQLFNIVSDLAYGTRTQYVSFDLNRDGVYSFVFIGTISNGKDGASVYSTDGVSLYYNKLTNTIFYEVYMKQVSN